MPRSRSSLGQIALDARRCSSPFLRSQLARAASTMRRVGFGLQLVEGQVLQLLAHAPACPCGRRAARRCRASPARCARASPAVMKCSVRMLCSRSASLTSSTRTSSAIASRSLRKFSACSALLGDEVELLELGQAVDQLADLVAEQCRRSRRGSRRCPRSCRAAARRRWSRRRASGR